MVREGPHILEPEQVIEACSFIFPMSRMRLFLPNIPIFFPNIHNGTILILRKKSEKEKFYEDI